MSKWYRHIPYSTHPITPTQGDYIVHPIHQHPGGALCIQSLEEREGEEAGGRVAGGRVGRGGEEEGEGSEVS